MSIKCGIDGSCPWLYQCATKTLTCHHEPIFPLTNYQYGIFSLFPICSAICNLSGNSFGEFKVLMFMDLLNYQQNQATTLAYPLITGTALYNFFDLIFKRHPTRNTSLIDYNVVMVIIPNILFGSTIGSLVNKFLPPIVADSLILVIMIGFSIKFFFRYYNFRKQQKAEKLKANTKLLQTDKTIGIQLVEKKLEDKGKVIQKNQQTIVGQPSNNLKQLKQIQNISILSNPQNAYQLAKLQKYQSGYHLPHVLATIIIFAIFQTLSFLAQGKIIPFSICSQQYKIGVPVLACFFLLFDFFMFQYTKKRLAYYSRVGYKYDVKISQPKYFAFVSVGAFLGGFNGGAFGIGNSTTNIFTLLFMEMQPAVVSATVGYQVVFAGSASLVQAFVTNSIEGNVALLFFLQTFIIGGLLTFIAKRLIRNFSITKVNKCLLLIVFCLVTTSVFALIAAIILGYFQFGPANMQDVPFHCPT